MERLLTTEKDNAKYIAYLELIFVSFMWAVSTILLKMYIDKIPPFHLLLGRFFIASLTLFLFSTKKVLKIEKEDLKIGSILGLLIFAVYALYILGLERTSASKSGFLAALSVLFIPIFESFIKKRMPTFWTIICVLSSIFGLYLISGMNGGNLNFGDILVIGCAFVYTIYIIILDKYGADKDNHILSFIQLLIVTISSLFFSIFSEGLNITILIENIIVIIVIGVLGTGLTMYLQTKAQKVASPESVGIILLGEPLFTLILAFIFLHETILLRGLIGSGLIIISLVIAIIKKI
ncbi:DMT family transporter [Caloranaerobacter ferrireducens]|uniref:DMT family transporter n=1 Tax=Caloranaerobacter ferrireducens TaxID=1323370 RepID=UPI00084D9C55|nr:DMT family transporter [Caloranaerobacter ferrireducens]